MNCSGLEIAVEIKQIDPNRDDIEFEKNLSEGRFAVSRSITPGRRIRAKLGVADSQLREYSKGSTPTMVVIFDTTTSMAYTDPYNVKVGMFGLDAISLAVPRELQQEPYLAGYRSGGRRTLTEDMNTSISAVSMLFQITKHPPYLIAYHNHFGRVVIDPECLRPVVKRQFRLSEPDGRHIPDWIEV